MIGMGTCSVPGPNTRPKIYHNWLQHLCLNSNVTVVRIINLIIPKRLQKRWSTLKARWAIATLSSSTLLTRHLYVEHKLNTRLTSQYAFTHAMETLRERYSYVINTMISRFRDVRYTLRTRWSMIDGYTRSFFGRVVDFLTRYSLVRATRLGVTAA